MPTRLAGMPPGDLTGFPPMKISRVSCPGPGGVMGRLIHVLVQQQFVRIGRTAAV